MSSGGALVDRGHSFLRVLATDVTRALNTGNDDLSNVEDFHITAGPAQLERFATGKIYGDNDKHMFMSGTLRSGLISMHPSPHMFSDIVEVA